ncbi:MAG: transposase [Acidimicrobiaceae bacterium]|nr:transposase [Acidimicrobiaceae bacterium]
MVDAVWTAIAGLIPTPHDDHPLGWHRPRIPDRLCFRGILIRLVTGSSWVDIEQILNRQVSDTTLRSRHDEWIAAGVFDALKNEATVAFDRIIGLDLTEVSIDGSLHKAPMAAKERRTPPMNQTRSGMVRRRRGGRHPDRVGHRWGNRNNNKLVDLTLDDVVALLPARYPVK